MRPMSFLLILAFHVSCAHEKLSSESESANRSIVAEELRQSCPSEQCRVVQCWQDSEDAGFCKVEFSFVADSRQAEMLSAAEMRLHGRGLDVDLCAIDSVGTEFAEVAVAVLVVGVVVAILSDAHGNRKLAYSPYHSSLTSSKMRDADSHTCSSESMPYR